MDINIINIIVCCIYIETPPLYSHCQKYALPLGIRILWFQTWAVILNFIQTRWQLYEVDHLQRFSPPLQWTLSSGFRSVGALCDSVHFWNSKSSWMPVFHEFLLSTTTGISCGRSFDSIWVLNVFKEITYFIQTTLFTLYVLGKNGLNCGGWYV